ncbi:HNH endonuclease signature motif containing protein [Sinorhizobium meliloti]|uniref:HNH endonuclease signature motif containing protein n=1 Tax=Rhizobium meliloti TaxID=382 RepID=UPI000FDAB35D|nr:HNH endonuclease signature motif containing protein [Sinorhizobium meliloti]RVH33902.1 HNH endonuclease [Sinorhizobium meliloti]
MNATQKALMARGLDAENAAKLANAGWTINKLKLAGEDDLKVVGLDGDFIEALFQEARPPIPTEVLLRVLFANRYQCCVCRDAKKSVIVHHIEEWADSRLHDYENLAVLCLHHHDQAHSKKTLSKNLDVKALRDAKEKWEAEVKRFDAEAILAAMHLEYSNWNYMNELRIFELANVIGIDFNKTPGFNRLIGSGLVQSDGFPSPIRDESLFYMYEGPDILPRYFYVSGVLNAVIEKLSIINISDHLDKGVLGFALAPGDFIFVQGSHTFSPTANKKDGQGRGQICEGVRRANGVEVRFTFDRWEAASSSAKNCWLVGTRNQGSLVHVKDLSREAGRLVIRGTVLGICSNFGALKTREYARS